MRRRAVLASGVVGLFACAGCTAPGRLAHARQDWPEYGDHAAVVDEHEELELRLRDGPVHLGDTIEFEVTNVGTADVSLGCDNPWALQRYADDGWRHVTWTADRYYQLCLTLLAPGNARVESFTVSVGKLEERASEVETALEPGRYRFVLLGPDPFLAREFEVLDGT